MHIHTLSLYSRHFYSAYGIISADRGWRLRTPKAPLVRPGVCTPEMYREIIESDGREGANGVGDGNGHGSGVEGSNGDVNGDGDELGMGTGIGVETQGRTPNGDGNGSGDRNERSSGDGNGDGDGTEDGIGEGGGEVKKHKNLRGIIDVR